VESLGSTTWLAPLVLITVAPFVLGYRLFFKWWLNPLLDRRFERKLQEDVRTDLAFLFRDFGGRFVANERVYRNATVVTVEAADLRIVISQHHGDYGISVGRQDHPEKGESLDSILSVVYESEGSVFRPAYADLKDLGSLLREKFDQVQMALSEARYSDTVAAVDKRHQQGMEKMAQTFNRPDGFFDAELVNPNDLTKKVSK
jgi:hypothetical protein